MRISKKGLQSIIVILSLVIMATIAVNGKNSNENTRSNNGTTAGVVTALNIDKDMAKAKVEQLKSELVSAKKEEDTPKAKEPEVSSEEKFWENRLMVTVKDSLNVRAKASKNSKLVGIMFPKCGAKILKETDHWVKIQSGNLKGYIKKEYCVFGEEAMKLAKKSGCYRAKATTGGVRVRYKASTESKIYTVVDEGSSLKLAKKECKVNGWVAVNYNGKRAFISEEYIRVGYKFDKGLTMKEYKKKLAAEEARKAEKAAKAAKAANSDSTQQDSIASNVDDVTLLAALIDCEAGAQTYAGKLAVGAVVCNRIRSSRYPNTLRGVIYQSGQFGPAHSGALARKLNGTINAGCRRAAIAALAGEDNVGGALHFRSRHSGIDGLIICGHVFY